MKHISVAMLAFAIGCSGKQSDAPSGNNPQPVSGAAPIVSAAADRPAKASADEVAKQRKLSQENLKKIGIALYEQQDKYGLMFLSAFDGTKDYPNLSWRVGILPFLGKNDLFKQFKLDEPWDSEHNFVPKSIPEKELRALITPNGGDKVTWDFNKQK